MGWPLFWTALDIDVKPYYDAWHEAQQRTQTGSEEIQSHIMRNVWWDIDPSETPSGRGPDEQPKRERDDSVPEMPHEGAYAELDLGERESKGGDLQDLRGDIPTEEVENVEAVWQAGMPKRKREIVGRVAVGVKARIDRLKAIGNGQVPAVAALAWDILTKPKSSE